uniref:Cap-specific mRNA (nucleoside-2'-O-)-methyltransferase 1 n=1 Tax=Astyanax mexicanus TaxID=7994 RepID=W5L0A0_ASTMX
MKRKSGGPDEATARKKVRQEEASSDEDEESSQRTTSQDSSQSESLSDAEDHRPSFSKPAASENSQINDASQSSSNFSMYNSVSQKLMAKMGFKEGEGLGKFGQGRKEIVEASTQRGRRGLGLTLQGFQGELNVDWQDEPEATAFEEVSWFPECSTEMPDAEELRDWMAVGERKLKIDDETEFCSENLLHLLLRCKSVFDDLEGEEMRRARTRSNPYETIRGVLCILFTLFMFGMLCCIVLCWFVSWEFKMYLYIVCVNNSFNPCILLLSCPAGEGGVEGDGDITLPENISAFRNFVLENTERRGLHFLMADGGFSVEGQENIQEILSKQLLLCQFLTALSVVRTGGHFVCKTFDLFTPFSVGLTYLLYLCFERVSLFKPVTSRPANSERYVVCRGLKPGSDPVREYLFNVNLRLNQFRHTERDVVEVVPLDIIKGDTDFYHYMINSNERFMEMCNFSTVSVFLQIPDQARVAPSSSDPRSKFQELVKGSDIKMFNSRPTALSSSTLERLQHVLDHRCIVGGGEQIFLLGLGKSQIYTWDGKAPLRWRKLENFKLELPRETLLSVEIVQELKGEGKAQRRINAVHVLDALVLNGTDVREQHFNQRIQMAEKFVKAVSKHSRPDMNPIRSIGWEEMDKIFVRLEMKVTKSSGGMPRLSYTGRDDRHFLPSGLYIIKTVNDPWTMAYSKSSKRKFFFNKQTKVSTFDMHPTAVAPFHVCHQERMFWAWEEGVRVHDSQTRVDPGKLSKDHVLSFIHKHSPQLET